MDNLVKAFEKIVLSINSVDELTRYFIDTTDGKQIPGEVLSELIKVFSGRVAQLNAENDNNPTAWYDELSEINQVVNTPKTETVLTEARSSEEIMAEITRLEQELKQAQAAEKKASYNGKLPTTVWIWDMYLDPTDKGTWCSAEESQGKYSGTVFETEDKALSAGWDHLQELMNEDELYDENDNPCDPDDYYIEATEISIADVDTETLEFSNLEHLI